MAKKRGALEALLEVKLFSPWQTYYEGKGVSVSAINSAGPFDVLSGHVNFFSLLTPGDVVVDTGYEQLRVHIVRGFVKVADNHVTIFANV